MSLFKTFKIGDVVSCVGYSKWGVYCPNPGQIININLDIDIYWVSFNGLENTQPFSFSSLKKLSKKESQIYLVLEC